jgi:hypothetical protein
MTRLTTAIVALLAAGGLVAGIAAADTGSAARTALVIDASLARDGRDTVDDRLEDVDGAVRVPRTGDEARTNVRYFTELGYRIVVAGPRASAAADSTGARAVREPDLPSAVAAVGG